MKQLKAHPLSVSDPVRVLLTRDDVVRNYACICSGVYLRSIAGQGCLSVTTKVFFNFQRPGWGLKLGFCSSRQSMTHASQRLLVDGAGVFACSLPDRGEGGPYFMVGAEGSPDLVLAHHLWLQDHDKNHKIENC